MSSPDGYQAAVKDYDAVITSVEHHRPDTRFRTDWH